MIAGTKAGSVVAVAAGFAYKMYTMTEAISSWQALGAGASGWEYAAAAIDVLESGPVFFGFAATAGPLILTGAAPGAVYYYATH